MRQARDLREDILFRLLGINLVHTIRIYGVNLETYLEVNLTSKVNVNLWVDEVRLKSMERARLGNSQYRSPAGIQISYLRPREGQIR